MPQGDERLEADVCFVGSGITAAVMAEKLAEERDCDILVLEAGRRPAPEERRSETRSRYLSHDENPWPEDHIADQTVAGTPHGWTPAMTVGGLAMHWGGVTPRFSPEDFRVRSTYGVGRDWPISYSDLDPFYQEAEERIGVGGVQGPEEVDPRGGEYPMPAMPLTWNLEKLRDWGEASGVPFWPMPQAKNTEPRDGRPVCCRNDTCSPICPIGAKYSPDHTLYGLEERGRIRLRARTLVRRLELEEDSDRIAGAVAADLDGGGEVRVDADTFVLAGGYIWTPHLLLLSAGSRYPDGLANSSGLVGKYLAGHRGVNAYVERPTQLYPGMNSSHSLVSKFFMDRAGDSWARQQGLRNGEGYLRHDFRIWTSTVGRQPRARDGDGRLLLGDELLEDWRTRTEGKGTARLRCYYDVLPARNSEITLEPDLTNRFGDPLPRVRFRDSAAARRLRPYQEESIARLQRSFAERGGGELLGLYRGDGQAHPGGGCRMGDDPSESVVDPRARSHDHENLFIPGAPSMVTGGCTNGTLTFCALGLMSAAEIGRGYPAREEPGGAGGA